MKWIYKSVKNEDKKQNGALYSSNTEKKPLQKLLILTSLESKWSLSNVSIRSLSNSRGLWGRSRDLSREEDLEAIGSTLGSRDEALSGSKQFKTNKKNFRLGLFVQNRDKIKTSKTNN